MRIIRAGACQVSLRSRVGAWLFLLAVGAFACFMAFEALRIATAATLGESTRTAALERALSLDPLDSQLHYRLGLSYCYSTERPHPGEGLKHLRRATELKPDEALYWSDLASACESVRDIGCADRAIERALGLSPMTPRLYWAAANHYLRTNRPALALERFRRLLDLDTAYALPTFQVCLQVLGDPQSIEARVLPARHRSELELAYLNFLSLRGEVDFAYTIWRRIALQSVPTAKTGAPPFPFSAVEPYLNRLIDLGRYGEALSVWHDLERLHVLTKAALDADPNQLIFNGGFEQLPLNSGFDWRYQEQPFVSLDFADPAAHKGFRCLRVEFTAKQNLEYEPVYQLVPVTAGRSYLLTAYVRTDDIASDSGPRLRVLDPFCPSCLDLSTEGSVGATPWHPVRLSFSAGSQTRLVRLSVWRPRSRAFPSEIEGVFWIDDIALRVVDASPGRAGVDVALNRRGSGLRPLYY